MARKTTGSTTTRKKAAPPAARPAVEVRNEVHDDVRKNGKPASPVPFNLEEEIRRRAYELYLQRQASMGNGNGDENQDWLIAEREILSLHGGQEHHTA